MKNSLQRICSVLSVGLALSAAYSAVQAQQQSTESAEGHTPVVAQASPRHEPPARVDTWTLQELNASPDTKLHGMHNAQTLEFTLRKDLVVEDAELNLFFTPSPALLPKLSHLRVYLNDELMGVVNIDADALGKQLESRVPLSPMLMTSFNRIRLEFVGHYTDICEDLTHSSLWLDISKKTTVRINQRMLPVANDLAYFPEPFLDMGDMQAQTVPFVFTEAPNTVQLKAAGVLASYLGTRARWRDLDYPVHFGQLPEQHAVVFATNAQRPAFLKDYPEVTAPTIELMANPRNPHYKLLLVLGAEDADLVAAASALAIGNPVFRGRSVVIDEVAEVAPRKPYDAPYWLATDRPVSFGELADYPGQLEVSGVFPRPISLDINLPPDLFVWRNSGIPMKLQYHYAMPSNVDQANLVVSVNDQLADGYGLKPNQSSGYLERLRLPLLGEQELRQKEHLLKPALLVGLKNQIRFDFSFGAIMGSAQEGMCQTILPPDVRASIDPKSTIDFSGFHHFMAMPNLRAFAGSGYPFSRMADLSETVVVVPHAPTAVQASTFLEALSKIGAQLGYPALKMRVMDNWDQASDIDADVLFIGAMPEGMRSRPDANLLLKDTQAVLYQSRDQHAKARQSNDDYWKTDEHQHAVVSKAAVRSAAPIAAIVGLQSERFPKRSVVGLLASTEQDYGLLREALASTGKREVMEGSVVIIREPGVHAEMVGPVYYVGHLPWWKRLWYFLSDHPFLMAGLAFVLVLLFAVLLWKLLRAVARRRLEHDA